MTRMTLLHLGITGGLLGAVTYLFVQSTSLAPAEHVRISQALSSLSQIESDVRRNLLLVRAGLLLHYDSLNQVVAGLHHQLEVLDSKGATPIRTFSDDVTSRFDAVADNVDQEEELVERFKSSSALLRNSWAYFTQRSRAVSEFNAAAPISDEFTATVGRLLPTMLHTLRSPDSQATGVAAELLDRLQGIAVPRELESHVNAMVVHGRLILELSPELDATLKQLLSFETAARMDALRTAYLGYHRRAADRGERHRFLLYAVSLLLFVYLGYLFYRLRASARALAQLNEGLVQEISERRQAEQKSRELQAELAHTHRLSLIGEMASGLAHELNQPLTAIRLYAKGCAKRLRTGEGTRDEVLAAMDRLSSEVLRAGEIVSWIRGFVRKQQPRTMSVDMNGLIREAVDLLSHEVGEQDVQVNLDLSHRLPRVDVDKIEIQQIILNLTRNSMEAMTENGSRSGDMTISTSKAENGAIEVAIHDTGPGMPAEVLARAFDSFFTTKSNGMGLGLSICRSMVESHGGQLWATSKEGVGATFHFTLPTAKQEHDDNV